MGTLILWGMIVLGVFMGIVIFSLLSLAQKGEQIYELVDRAEEIARPANPLYRMASETRSPASSREAQPQRDLSASVAAP